MADLPFLDKLDKNQLEIAEQIVTRAQKIGVDPRLALSLAFVESGLKMDKVGEDGEIGIMQIKPNTGKMLGVDVKGLRDTGTNIDTGLMYLKQGIDRYKDPQLGALAYNAGHDAAFLVGKSKDPLERSITYLNKINSLGGFSQPDAAPVAEGAVASQMPDLVSDIVNIAKAVPAATVAAAGNRPLPSDASTAAGAGAVAGSLIGAGTKTLAESSAAKSVAAGTPVENWAKSMGYGNRGAQTYGQAHQFEQGTRKGATIRNPASGQTYKPEFNFQKPPIIQAAPTMGQKVMGALDTAGGVMSKAPRLSGALAGAGVGFSGKDAAERYNRGDYLGAGVAGVGALGSAASMIPHPLTRGIGAAVGMMSPLALSVLDGLRDQPAQPQQ